MSESPSFFSCDWGTSSFRLRLVSRTGTAVLDELRSETGVKAIHAGLGPGAAADARSNAFADYFVLQLETLARRSGLPVQGAQAIVSGMASSTVGWHELPYAVTPASVDGSNIVVGEAGGAALTGRGMRAWLVSGLRTETEIMRGEESEILGLFAPSLGVDCPRTCRMILPGTHSKHVQIEDGVIVDFRTAMTGEVCDVLGRHSLLGASVLWPPEAGTPTGAGREAFEEGLALVRGLGLTRSLFRTRTRAVLDRVDPAANAWFLSALLIGDEVRALASDSGGDPIVLAASRRFSSSYTAALHAMGAGDRLHVIPPETVDRATIHGHAILLDRVHRASSP